MKQILSKIESNLYRSRPNLFFSLNVRGKLVGALGSSARKFHLFIIEKYRRYLLQTPVHRYEDLFHNDCVIKLNLDLVYVQFYSHGLPLRQKQGRT